MDLIIELRYYVGFDVLPQGFRFGYQPKEFLQVTFVPKNSDWIIEIRDSFALR